MSSGVVAQTQYVDFFAMMKRVHIVATDRIIEDTPVEFEI